MDVFTTSEIAESICDLYLHPQLDIGKLSYEWLQEQKEYNPEKTLSIKNKRI